MSLYTLILSALCIVCGTVLQVVAPEGPIALTLVIAGLGGGSAAVPMRGRELAKQAEKP